MRERTEAFDGAYAQQYGGGQYVAPMQADGASIPLSVPALAADPTDAQTMQAMLLSQLAPQAQDAMHLGGDEVADGSKQFANIRTVVGHQDLEDVVLDLVATSGSTKTIRLWAGSTLRGTITLTADGSSDAGGSLVLSLVDDGGTTYDILTLERKAGESCKFTRSVETTEHFMVDGLQVVGAQVSGVGGSFGTATAGASYGSGEQTMLQQAHDKVRLLEAAMKAHGLVTD